MSVKQETWGSVPEVGSVEKFTIENANGCRLVLSSFGATIVELHVPDRSGHLQDIVHGFGSAAEYDKHHDVFFGATIGRFANRIDRGRFTMDGVDYILPSINNEPNHLHGGYYGFHRRVWTGEICGQGDQAHVKFSYFSPHGEEGYPGNLQVTVSFSLSDENEVTIKYSATSDAKTPINLTNHSYFNLNPGQSISGHRFELFCSTMLPVSENLIPEQHLMSVIDTPFDFTRERMLAGALAEPHIQLDRAGGIDHCYVADSWKKGSSDTFLIARVSEAGSGRVMEVETSEPAVQFYSGNFLDGSFSGKGGKSYPFRSAFCLETQHFPDSPNRPDYPRAVLEPGETFESTTIYRFGIE